ncbi:MAG: cellulase family glycosylhydrolase [Ferruginibacter sp.]|nr:cellulase family glycosylhydrolase [Ferruginibacter sp.]
MIKFICLLIVLSLNSSKTAIAQSSFIKAKKISFVLDKQTYQFKGTNYWYGGYLLNNKKRLTSELDFLRANHITNLRVFISSEGDSTYPYRIYPSIQPQQGIYNEQLLKGFDYLLVEAKKRKLKIVFVLNNNWEWSGGFAQYLQWNGYGTPPLPKTSLWDWDKYCDYISKFYSCNNCISFFNKFITHILKRKNTITKQYYYNDNTIMAWELANEPRPMRKEATQSYIKWVKNTSALIKSIDKNHLVTIGVEGALSTFYDTAIFSTIHSLPTIDYATIHLWPKTWQWYNGESGHAVTDTTLQRTKIYIEQHANLCKKINKPLVIEEFGMHRDENSFSSKATVQNRDKYFTYVFTIGKQNNIAGYNFWGFAGIDSNTNDKLFMQKGMPYSADPPQEEQGLYSVFKTDSSTFKLIKNINKK